MGMLWGYFRSMIANKPRYEDADFRRFLRRYQYACLLLGKKRATERLNEQQYDVWARNHTVVGTSHEDLGTAKLVEQS
jgi:hypothetical protein